MSAVLGTRSTFSLHLPANMGHFRQAALATTIRRDLTWAFCSPVKENVKVLTIPLSDIDRYLACVSKFKSLINVSFLMDEVLDLYIIGEQSTIMVDGNNGTGTFGHEAMGGPPLDLDLEEAKEAMRIKRNQQFKTMFEFDIIDQLKSLLPTANRVSVVDRTNLIQVTNHIQKTNLKSIEGIELTSFESRDAASSLMIANLNRCRGLKRFIVPNLDPEAFKWAVEERIAWDRYHAAIAAKAAAIMTGSKNNP
ncbi:hypothetical protein BGZ83_004282, partial [Gryganskiella cystojenkinii]